MAGLLDLISARNPGESRQTLADLVRGPQNRLRGLLDDPAGFMGSALREGLGADDMERRWAWNQNKLDAMTGSDYTRASVDDAANRAALNLGLMGTFIGKNAKTWDAATNQQAQKMEKAGADPRAIWKETGNWKGPDGFWRQEIPDNAADWNMKQGQYFSRNDAIRIKDNANGSYAESSIKSIFNHPELQKSYPLNTNVTLKSYGRGASGEYSGMLRDGFDSISLDSAISKQPVAVPNNGPFAISAKDAHKLNAEYASLGTHRLLDPKTSKSTLLHELQHAIQQREGWAKGGSHEMFNQHETAVLARDALSWRNELLRKRKEMPKADWINVENAVVEEYQKMGAMAWLPSREARDLARQPAVLFPDKYPNVNEGFNDLKELVSAYGLDKHVTPSKPMDMYRRLAGEAEARATQARMNMDMAQRRATFPADSYDVPLDQLIIRGLLE